MSTHRILPLVFSTFWRYSGTFILTMTWGLPHIIGVIEYERTGKRIDGLLWSNKSVPAWVTFMWTYLFGCHLSHTLDFAFTLLFYSFLWPVVFPHATGVSTENYQWVLVCLAYNLSAMLFCNGVWHYVVYVWADRLRERKFNIENQYENSSNQLFREVFQSTLAWIQLTAWQCAIMWCMRTGVIEYYPDFFAMPKLFNLIPLGVAQVLFVSYWREFHFYWIHRIMHPGVKIFGWDLGAFLYKQVHITHHLSRNIGPWSGFSMSVAEVFLYLTCALTVFLGRTHPLHFLYILYHAGISPIAGHDGYGAPGGNSDYHYIHHAYNSVYPCNFGTSLIDFDILFGTKRHLSDFGVVSPNEVPNKVTLRNSVSKKSN
jgi:sterol desaturase/sphingolipid hydroxylase (fatty acid hydroxylase superfamily)